VTSGAPPPPLRVATSPDWAPLALESPDRLLQDHAHCEKKAAATAISLIATYPERSELAQPLVRLAQEETQHFFRVLAELTRRGHALERDHGDPYAHALLELARAPREERLLDRILISAIIEARSCERFQLLGESDAEPRLARLYGDLFLAEARHHELFVKLAGRLFGPAIADARLDTLLDAEARIVKALPLRPAIH
jgi:tRNA 2-(methylsulfanyl)-N6-isopentenyladenosine37 hydroxylase